MNIRRLILPVLTGIALTSPSRAILAQQAGVVELGGFLQLDRLDEALTLKRLGGGAGGRAGVFFAPRWELEAEASFTQADAQPSRTAKTQINYYVGRLNYNIPWGTTPGNAVILGAGAGLDRLDGFSDFIVSPDLGLRVQLLSALGLRFDVLSMFATSPSAPDFRYYQASPTTLKKARFMENTLARVGLSLMLGTTPPAVVMPTRAIDTTMVADTRAADRARARQDSIDRANRARQDSIDAANRRAQAERDAAAAAAARALAEARSMLNTAVYFDYDKSEIRADAKATLDAKLPLLRANPTMKIRIEGNTDSRGSNEYNMALGLRRANAARRYLASQGIDDARFDVVSYGAERPVDQGTTEDAYQKNRRDDFVITVGGDNISVPR